MRRWRRGTKARREAFIQAMLGKRVPWEARTKVYINTVLPEETAVWKESRRVYAGKIV